MARQWRKADRDLRCGYDWCHIPKGQPYQEIRLRGVHGVMVRCEQHADGPANWEQIHSAESEKQSMGKPVSPFKRVTEDAPFDPKLARLGSDV